MTLYTVEMQGNWTRAWPNQPIPFLDCVFNGNERGGFRVSTEIQAQNDEEARHQGRARIEEACYFFEFCLGGSMLLVPNQVATRQEGSIVSEGAISVEMKTIVYSPTPPPPHDLQRLNDVQNKIKQNDFLRRVIRWWGEARRETEPIDRFIKLWVAFEVLTKSQYGRKQFISGAKGWLAKLYPNHDKVKIEQLVNKLQKTRSDVFLHKGEWNIEEAQSQGLILEAVLEDLVTDYFGLPAKLKVARYLS